MTFSAELPRDEAPPSPGYLNPLYSESLREFGEPVALGASGGYLLRRSIPDAPFDDAMGCYPLFSCKDWRQLSADFDSLGDELVSVVAVPDPFGNWDKSTLDKAFPDFRIAFKEHFVTDLAQEKASYMSRHSRRYAGRSSSYFSIDFCESPSRYLGDWVRLYGNLIRRHGIAGIAAFSKASFEKQLRVPGVKMFRASLDGETCGAMLWYAGDDVAYYHLGAYNETGYEQRASYGLISAAIDYFAEAGLKWLNLGGAAGLRANENDGLARFKSGWATDRRLTYLCGRINNRALYDRLSSKSGNSGSGYFPAYRTGEFD